MEEEQRASAEMAARKELQSRETDSSAAEEEELVRKKTRLAAQEEQGRRGGAPKSIPKKRSRATLMLMEILRYVIIVCHAIIMLAGLCFSCGVFGWYALGATVEPPPSNEANDTWNHWFTGLCAVYALLAICLCIFECLYPAQNRYKFSLVFLCVLVFQILALPMWVGYAYWSTYTEADRMYEGPLGLKVSIFFSELMFSNHSV